MKAVVAAFNQEKALVGAFSVITNLWMDLFEALDTGAKDRAKDTAEKEGEDTAEEVADVEAEEAVMVRAASVCFSEGTGSYSSLVSADTWPRGSPGPRAQRATVQV